MTNTKTKTTFFLRTGAKTSDPMTAAVVIGGLEGQLIVNAAGECKVFRKLKEGFSKKPMATGTFAKHPRAGQGKNPDIRAVVSTGKGARITFVGWAHDIENDPYYVLHIDDFQRKGTFHTF